MRAARQQRVARAAAAATLATFVALLSHSIAGGARPDAGGLLLVWALALVIATVLIGRRLSLVRLAVVVGLAQVGFHLFFVVCAPGVSSGRADAVHGHAAHAHMPPQASTAGVETAASASAAAFSDIWMWTAHLVAALMTVAVLHRGERIVVTLLRQAERLACRIERAIAPVSVQPLPVRQRMRMPDAVVIPLVGRPLVAVAARRGPPRLSVL